MSAEQDWNHKTARWWKRVILSTTIGLILAILARGGCGPGQHPAPVHAMESDHATHAAR